MWASKSIEYVTDKGKYKYYYSYARYIIQRETSLYEWTHTNEE